MISRKRNKDPCGGINCKVKGVLVCQLCFKNFTLIFISTLSLGWLLSIIQYYCGRLLRGNIFKDSKSLKGQRKPLMLYSLFQCLQLCFCFSFCFAEKFIVRNTRTTVIMLLKIKGIFFFFLSLPFFSPPLLMGLFLLGDQLKFSSVLYEQRNKSIFYFTLNNLYGRNGFQLVDSKQSHCMVCICLSKDHQVVTDKLI